MGTRPGSHRPPALAVKPANPVPMNPHLLIVAFSATFLLFVVLLGTALWKDLRDLRKYFRRRRHQPGRFQELMSVARMRDRAPETRTMKLENVWLTFG